MVFCGAQIEVTDNFISPNSTGLTINNATYLLYENQAAALSNINQNCYVELVNVSYLPILQTVTLKFFTNLTQTNSSVGANATTTIGYVNSTTNSTYNLTANKSTQINIANVGQFYISSNSNKNVKIIITNITGTSIIPPPDGLLKIVVLNVAVLPQANVSINATLDYPCTDQSPTIRPYELNKTTWEPITDFRVDASNCKIIFTVFTDPTLALFQVVNKSSTVPTTSILTSTPTTTISLTLPKITITPQTLRIIAAAIVVIIIVVVALLYPRYKRRSKYGKFRYIKE